jgi:N-acetyl sugar amidotransferase
MTILKQICTKGVWDNSVPGISFDNEGVSNYARLYENLSMAYPRGLKGKSEWDSIVNKIKAGKKNNKYDCVIGVSGGTDSCYLLHLAKAEGLNPLAVHLDNGWDSEVAVNNIEKVTTALGIDLKTYVINYEEVKDLFKSYMKAGMPWIDLPTDLAIKAILYKYASQEDVKYILRGNDFRSEGSQPNEWTYGDGRQLMHIHKTFGKIKLKTFPNYTLTSLIYYGLIKQIKSVYPFYYIDYNKIEAQKFLEKQYNWKYYGGHHYENLFTKFSISYWLYEKFGIDKRIITLSAQILGGQISRENALEILSQSPYKIDEINEIIAFVIKKLDMSEQEFTTIMKGKNCNYRDYNSYEWLMTNFKKISAPLLKLIFIHKPQSLFQDEIRKGK